MSHVAAENSQQGCLYCGERVGHDPDCPEVVKIQKRRCEAAPQHAIVTISVVDVLDFELLAEEVRKLHFKYGKIAATTTSEL